MASLKQKLSLLGANEASVHILKTSPAAETLSYLDLLDKDKERPDFPDAVVEFQDRPLLYIADCTKKTPRTDNELVQMRRTIFLKGDGAYLAKLEPGKLTVYSHIKASDWQSLEVFDSCSDEEAVSRQFIPSLGLAFNEKESGKTKFVHNLLFDLMAKVINEVTGCGLSHEEALSLAGRALFLRFLLDRKIINDQTLKKVCGSIEQEADCFSAKNAANMNYWLDQTFNGELLPLPDHPKTSGLYKKYFAGLNDKVFTHLQAILARAEVVGSGYQLLFDDWEFLNFAHIPVGLLSQVYEQHLHKFEAKAAHSTSVYYTPHHIAKYMVDESFYDLPNPHQAKILDPSCGAGIFLVLCYHRLVQERWLHDQKRPDTKALRKILYEQIVGLDINESALRLSALSLYLSALELDGAPQPVEKLKFEKLAGKILFNVDRDQAGHGQLTAGSLAPELEKQIKFQLKNQFDLVIGNPPWTKYRAKNSSQKQVKSLNHLFSSETRRILKERREWSEQQIKEIQKIDNPGNAPDIPFIWKSLEWAKPDARITLALHGKILFGSQTEKIRKYLFQTLQITGLFNGAALRQSEVWPNMDQPFVLLFSKNKVPSLQDSFFLVSPYVDKELNDNGVMRIDPMDAELVSHEQVIKEPQCLKVLFKGGYIFLPIAEKLGKINISVKQYWNKSGLKHRRGFQTEGAQKSLNGDFTGLQTLTKESKLSFNVSVADLTNLPFFERGTLHSGENREYYCAPLLLAHKKVPGSRKQDRALLCNEDVVYRNEYYGYSTHGHNSSGVLIGELYLIIHSAIFLYYNLIKSSEYGFERDIIYKEDIDNFPFIPPEDLSDAQKEKVTSLAERLAHDEVKPFDEIDDFVYSLYGLTKPERQIIEDTLAVNLPTAESQKKAQSIPTRPEVTAYLSELKRILNPFFKITDQAVEITSRSPGNHIAYRFFSIHLKNEIAPEISSDDLSEIFQKADETGASQIIIQGREVLHIAILNRYRYFTKTRARFLALEIIEKHLDVFSLPAKAEK